MDTVSNLAGSAHKAVFGNNVAGEEPVAGSQGAGTATEPFDKGNEEAGKEAGSLLKLVVRY